MTRLDWRRARTHGTAHIPDYQGTKVVHMRARHPGPCRNCTQPIHRGDPILYLPDMRDKAAHQRCPAG